LLYCHDCAPSLGEFRATEMLNKALVIACLIAKLMRQVPNFQLDIQIISRAMC
jgi:hypothetical protein